MALVEDNIVGHDSKVHDSSNQDYQWNVARHFGLMLESKIIHWGKQHHHAEYAAKKQDASSLL